jgi:hypothetical protein
VEVGEAHPFAEDVPEVPVLRSKEQQVDQAIGVEGPGVGALLGPVAMELVSEQGMEVLDINGWMVIITGAAVEAVIMVRIPRVVLEGQEVEGLEVRLGLEVPRIRVAAEVGALDIT